jgi:hypothetical protein
MRSGASQRDLEAYVQDAGDQEAYVSDGFVGEFFFGDDPDRLPVVWIGGSGSGLAINAIVAAPLASHGFNVLSLPFFGDAGLPKQLSRIPLEYFEAALEWLRRHPATAGRDVRMLAMSKGAEAGLILTSRCPFIRKAALWSPHAYCFQGIAYKDESSWTYQGRDLAYIQLRNRWVFSGMLGGFLRNRPFEFASVYRKGLEVAPNKVAARIKVEDAQADLLMFTSKECGMWNTYDGCVEIMNTLKEHNYPHQYDLVVYENAGEPYLVPYVFPSAEASLKMAPRLVLSLGGTLQGNAHARSDAWERAVRLSRNNRILGGRTTASRQRTGKRRARLTVLPVVRFQKEVPWRCPGPPRPGSRDVPRRRPLHAKSTSACLNRHGAHSQGVWA